jgi:tRNA G18 (ribose-2'-O)-methylase SpoU
MGGTRLILSRSLILEAGNDLPLATTFRKREISVLLDNIRSAWNVGSILRSANGFGYSHVYICGITPTPDNDAVKKTSLGAENSVNWTYHKDAVLLVKEIRLRDTTIIGLEDHERSRSLLEVPNDHSPMSTVLIVGNEITGIDPHLLDMCDKIYHIPMQGVKKSFNVAIAFGIASYALE